jgi:penicillin-binding protein 2
MFLLPARLSVKSVFAILLCFCFTVFAVQTQAQKKKPAAKEAPKKAATSKTQSKKADDKKSAKTTASAKDKKQDKTQAKSKGKEQEDSKTSRNSKGKKPTKEELARQAEQKRRDAVRLAEQRRAEEARRQAILAEQRRREQAAREARARALAFERGLRTETVENIANDNTEGEDLEVRRAAINALGNHAGTVVVMEPQTGKILSIVNQDWGIRKGFKPCSTIKLVTGVAGLNENVIDQGGNITPRNFRMNLDDALAHSNNAYFQVVGSSLGTNRMINYAKALGLGEKTGINADDEAPGRLPYGNNNARIYSHGDDFEVTPLQLAVAVSAISNGGKIVVPQIPKNQSQKVNFRGAMRREVNVPQQNMQRVLPGMIGAVNYGTARRSGGSEFNAAGKTGSCIGQGSWLGLFASVAPVVNPKLAVVVVTRGQAERGKYASAIAGNVYRALKHRYTGEEAKDFVAKVPLELKPQQKASATTSASLDTNDEDSDESDVPVAKSNSAKPNPKKGGEDIDVTTPKIQKTGSSKPTNTGFSPIVIQVNREKSRPRIVPNP